MEQYNSVNTVSLSTGYQESNSMIHICIWNKIQLFLKRTANVEVNFVGLNAVLVFKHFKHKDINSHSEAKYMQTLPFSTF